MLLGCCTGAATKLAKGLSKHFLIILRLTQIVTLIQAIDTKKVTTMIIINEFGIKLISYLLFCAKQIKTNNEIVTKFILGYTF